MSEMSILEMRRLLKERALEGNKASTTIRHQMAAAKAKYDAETDASKDKSMGTVGGAVGPFALDKGYDALMADEAAKEGLAGVKDYGAPVQSYNAQGIPNQLTPKGAEFNTPITSEASVFNAANHGAVDGAVGGTVGGTVGGGSTVGTITPAVVNPGPPVSVFNPASVTGPGSVSSMTEGALAGSAKGGSIGVIEGTGTGMVTGLEGVGTGMASNTVTPVAGAATPAAGAGALATGAAGLGAGLGGAAGAYGGKALAAEFTDDPTIQGVASVGGGALGGAAAGAAIGSAGGPIGAPIGAIIGAIGGLLGAF